MKSPSVPILTDEELNAREEKRRQYTKKYYADPEIKQKQREYYLKYNKEPINIEARRKSQARYNNSQKGIARKERYWQKRSGNNTKNKEDHEIFI